MSSDNWQPFCLGLNVLKEYILDLKNALNTVLWICVNNKAWKSGHFVSASVC